MFHIPAPQDCKVALIAGGTSGEREISLASKEGALTALNEAGYQVEWLDPAKEERFMEKVAKMALSRAFLRLSIFPTPDQGSSAAR